MTSNSFFGNDLGRIDPYSNRWMQYLNTYRMSFDSTKHKGGSGLHCVIVLSVNISRKGSIHIGMSILGEINIQTIKHNNAGSYTESFTSALGMILKLLNTLSVPPKGMVMESMIWMRKSMISESILTLITYPFAHVSGQKVPQFNSSVADGW